MFPHGCVFTFRVLAQQNDGVGGSSRLGFRLEGRCRGVVRLSIPPKAAYFEGRCRGVVPFRVPTKED